MSLELVLKEFLSRSLTNPLRKYLGTLLPKRREAKQAAKHNLALSKRIIANHRSKTNPANGTIVDLIVKNNCYANDDERAVDLIIYLLAGHDVSRLNSILLVDLLSSLIPWFFALHDRRLDTLWHSHFWNWLVTQRSSKRSEMKSKTFLQKIGALPKQCKWLSERPCAYTLCLQEALCAKLAETLPPRKDFSSLKTPMWLLA